MYKLELKSSHEVIETVNVADVESIFYCKPTDPDILTVLMTNGKRLYCDDVCPVQEEPVSEDLEEACEQLAQNARKHKAETSSPFFSQTDYKQGVIDGSKWQLEQMMAKAIDAHCFGFQGAALFSFRLPASNYLVGSKVKVIIIKGD